MATLKELRDAHEEMIELCYQYCALVTTIVDDTDEPDVQREVLAVFVVKARANITEATKVVDYLMALKEQPE